MVDVLNHRLVPRHEVLSSEEKEFILSQFNVSQRQLPRIKEEDPVAKSVNAKHGDVIRVTRASQTAGISMYYRTVV